MGLKIGYLRDEMKEIRTDRSVNGKTEGGFVSLEDGNNEGRTDGEVDGTNEGNVMGINNGKPLV